MSYLFTPGIEADTLTAWPPQAEAIDAVRAAFARGEKKAMVLHATGMGKSISIAKIARKAAEKGNRTLILVHLGELITQLANSVERVGIVPGIEKAGAYARSAFDPMVVIASVQSMQGARLNSWPRDHFKVIIRDEAHHGTCESDQVIFRHFTGYRLVGFTATADRLDGESVAAIFGPPVHEFDFFDAMLAPTPGPYLCPFEVHRKDIGVDLRGLSPGRKDFNADDLGAKIAPFAGQFAKSIRMEVGDRPGLTFVPNVLSATAFSSAMKSLGMSAEWVSGDDPFREDKISRYQSGELQNLICVQLLCEGFDAKHTAFVALCNPTRSRARIVQEIGRALRLSPGKENALILDYTWLVDMGKLRRPADLFEKQLGSQEAIDAADALMVEFPCMSIADVVEAAKKKGGTAKVERREIDVRVRGGDVHYVRSEIFDPLNGKAPAPARTPLMQARHNAPTDKMIGFLKSRGHANAAGYSKGYAGKLISIYKATEHQQQASA